MRPIELYRGQQLWDEILDKPAVVESVFYQGNAWKFSCSYGDDFRATSGQVFRFLPVRPA